MKIVTFTPIIVILASLFTYAQSSITSNKSLNEDTYEYFVNITQGLGKVLTNGNQKALLLKDQAGKYVLDRRGLACVCDDHKWNIFNGLNELLVTPPCSIHLNTIINKIEDIYNRIQSTIEILEKRGENDLRTWDIILVKEMIKAKILESELMTQMILLRWPEAKYGFASTFTSRYIFKKLYLSGFIRQEEADELFSNLLNRAYLCSKEAKHSLSSWYDNGNEEKLDRIFNFPPHKDDIDEYFSLKNYLWNKMSLIEISEYFSNIATNLKEKAEQIEANDYFFGYSDFFKGEEFEPCRNHLSEQLSSLSNEINILAKQMQDFKKLNQTNLYNYLVAGLKLLIRANQIDEIILMIVSGEDANYVVHIDILIKNMHLREESNRTFISAGKCAEHLRLGRQFFESSSEVDFCNTGIALDNWLQPLLKYD